MVLCRPYSSRKLFFFFFFLSLFFLPSPCEPWSSVLIAPSSLGAMILVRLVECGGSASLPSTVTPVASRKIADKDMMVVASETIGRSQRCCPGWFSGCPMGFHASREGSMHDPSRDEMFADGLDGSQTRINYQCGSSPTGQLPLCFLTVHTLFSRVLSVQRNKEIQLRPSHDWQPDRLAVHLTPWIASCWLGHPSPCDGVPITITTNLIKSEV